MSATITRRFGEPSPPLAAELQATAPRCKALHADAKNLAQIRLTHFYRVQWVTWHSLKQPHRDSKTVRLIAAQCNSVHAIRKERTQRGDSAARLQRTRPTETCASQSNRRQRTT